MAGTYTMRGIGSFTSVVLRSLQLVVSGRDASHSRRSNSVSTLTKGTKTRIEKRRRLAKGIIEQNNEMNGWNQSAHCLPFKIDLQPKLKRSDGFNVSLCKGWPFVEEKMMFRRKLWANLEAFPASLAVLCGVGVEPSDWYNNKLAHRPARLVKSSSRELTQETTASTSPVQDYRVRGSMCRSALNPQHDIEAPTSADPRCFFLLHIEAMPCKQS